jgi:terminase large subunit-like protein
MLPSLTREEARSLLKRWRSSPGSLERQIASWPRWTQQQYAAALRQLMGKPLPLDRYWLDPALILQDAGLTPDPWQADLMRCPDCWTMICATGRCGKTTVAAALILRKMLLEPKQTVLVLSPSEKQSRELYQEHVLEIWRAIGSPLKSSEPMDLRWKLANKSRLIALAENEKTARTYTAHLVVYDEAARVDKPLYDATTRMLGTTGGRGIALSTPFGRRGWFFDEWTKGKQVEPGKEGHNLHARHWKKIRVVASMCPRLSPEFLAAERASKGDAIYRQEYEAEFLADTSQYFADDDIAAAFVPRPGTEALLLD